MLWGEGLIFDFNIIANLILAVYLALPVLRASPFDSLGDINDKI